MELEDEPRWIDPTVALLLQIITLIKKINGVLMWANRFKGKCGDLEEYVKRILKVLEKKVRTSFKEVGFSDEDIEDLIATIRKEANRLVADLKLNPQDVPEGDLAIDILKHLISRIETILAFWYSKIMSGDNLDELSLIGYFAIGGCNILLTISSNPELPKKLLNTIFKEEGEKGWLASAILRTITSIQSAFFKHFYVTADRMHEALPNRELIAKLLAEMYKNRGIRFTTN